MKYTAIVAFALFASSAFAGDCCLAKKAAAKKDADCAPAAAAAKAPTATDSATTATASAGKKA